MSCFQPPFTGADPGWEDGCGFTQNTPPPPPAPAVNVQRGSMMLNQGYDRVVVIFPIPLPLGTSYDINVTSENTQGGTPSEQIYPTQLISRDHNVTSEIGFTYGLNAPPTAGPGPNIPAPQPSYTKFNWKITYYP